MSNPGQPIDPVMALAAQQQSGPPQLSFPQGDSRNEPAAVTVGGSAPAVDPVEALAASHAPMPSAPPGSAPSGTGGFSDPSGYASSIIRNVANAASFNLADPIAAATGALFPVKGYTSTKPTYGERYDELLKLSRGDTAEGQKSHPYVSLGSSVAGGMLNPVTNAMPLAKSLGGAILQGTTVGGAYGAGSSVGNSPNGLSDVLKQVGTGALTGGATGAAGYGLGKLLTGATRAPQAQLLADEGVPLTPGQSLGGTAHTLEDASTHIPMMGNAIKARQGDAIEGFNRAAYNRVLEPLGLDYAKDAPSGNEAIDKISGMIGDAYTNAYKGASVVKSPTLTNDIASATDEAANLLPKGKVSQIKANIQRLVTSKFGENGALSPDDLATAKNYFAEQSRSSPTASLEDRAAAGAYGKVVDALKAGISETDPERGAMLDAADKAYMRFVRVQQAASSNNASGRGGIFTAAQLGQALRSADNSTRHMEFSKGLAPMQDLAQAGQAVLPSTVPDSGTALRGLLELGAGGAITHQFSPEAATAGLGAIGAGTALYSRPGQSLARALLHGAPASRKAMGALVQKATPGTIAALLASGGGTP